jgi:hypothetical protein
MHYTRSKTLEIKNMIEKTLLNYIEESRIYDDVDLFLDIKRDLTSILKKNTRYNIQDTISFIKFLQNQYRIRLENEIHTPIVAPINISHNANIPWKDSQCSICYDYLKKKSIVKTECGHIYCVGCISEYMYNVRFKECEQSQINCPYCRSNIYTLFTNHIVNFEIIKNRCMY